MIILKIFLILALIAFVFFAGLFFVIFIPALTASICSIDLDSPDDQDILLNSQTNPYEPNY
jgi:hypothetical protein